MLDGAKPFREDDFAIIAELGFDFARLPMDYRVWTDPKDWTRLREERLKWVDDAVGFGRKHGVHVQLNFHRAPGYTVASPREPKSLWTDAEAQDVCAQHWATFAKRFPGRPESRTELRPVQRAGPGRGRAAQGGGREDVRGDPRRGSRPADRLRRPGLRDQTPDRAGRPGRGDFNPGLRTVPPDPLQGELGRGLRPVAGPPPTRSARTARPGTSRRSSRSPSSPGRRWSGRGWG